MSSTVQRLQLAYTAARQLGPRTIWQYGLYQAGLKTGYFRWRTPVTKLPMPGMDESAPSLSRINPQFFLSVPGQEQLAELLGEENSSKVIEEAEEILQGHIRLFGGESVQLCLSPTNSNLHWSQYKEQPGQDIKFIWEPARFSWVYTLGRAYQISGDERFPESFYKFLDTFLDNNPTNGGPNWISGQEIALRIFAFVFAWQVFSNSPASTPGRILRLYETLLAHASRIPLTLCYARSQNNNHLLTEAAGLFTASSCLPQFSKAASWRNLGWHWFNWAIQNQITSDGTYIQHSTNYHRLMLQTALWVQAAAKKQMVEFPLKTKELLAAATNWLMGQFDPNSGRVSNLGHNDGSYILPLAPSDFSDYRPVIQAASSAFLDEPCLPAGAWDEMGLWFKCSKIKKRDPELQSQFGEQGLEHSALLLGKNHWRLGNTTNWATLRSVIFKDRPAHADQLHVELWWRGFNLAMDAGTYLYTAPAPWQNTLMDTIVHNTIQVDGQNQMLRAGRFLWLNWAQSRQLFEIENDHTRAAEHDGYQHIGVKHQRTLMRVEPNEWCIRDRLIPNQLTAGVHQAVINWLLPDWPWMINEIGDSIVLQLQTPDARQVTIQVYLEETAQNHQPKQNSVRLIRAGEVVYGPERRVDTLGWVSPTYSQKLPALSFQLEFEGKLPFTILTLWTLPL
ncbi:MAG TPA: alginate lyase family protein [Anaerolineaceae bacterium]|nr:alginate lyase family protein [Anaerolineaceae bacterium]